MDCPSPLWDDIVACTGLSPQQLQDHIDPALSLDTLFPARWLALGPLVSGYVNEERVSTFLSHGTSELRHLNVRLVSQITIAEDFSITTTPGSLSSRT
jgi:hypothetical protein